MLLLHVPLIFLSSNLFFVNAITTTNPCDPMETNVNVETVLKSDLQKIMTDLKIKPSWFIQPMRYINCSRRGLDKIPVSLPSNVQILDLSSNEITCIRKRDLKKFAHLEVLWLNSNRMGYSQNCHINRQNYLSQNEYSFDSLENLKMLSLADNKLKQVTRNSLPTTLEYLDISQNPITKICSNDLSHLKNLRMFDGANLCNSLACKHLLHVDYDVFEKLPLTILSLSHNYNVFYVLNYVNSQSLLYLNFAQTYGLTLGPEQLKNMTSVKRLELYLQNPNTEVMLQVLDKAFDKLRDLEYLDLSSNRIEYIPKNVFRYNHNLSFLDLSGNCLYPSILDPKYVPKQIQYLLLGYNYCSNVDTTNATTRHSLFGRSFAKLKHLKMLSYEKPKNLGSSSEKFGVLNLNEISYKSLFNLLPLKMLSKLIISENFVQKVDLSIIGCLTGLDYLDLSNNIIGNVYATHQPCITQRSKASEVKCFEEVKLIFSYNKIGTKLENRNLVHSKATWLDFQFNLVSSIRSKAFKNMPCLAHIDLRNNPILFIHTDSFKNLFNLNTLYIKSMSLFPSNERSFRFLHYITLYNISQSFYLSLLNDNLFQSLQKEVKNATIAKHIINVDLSQNRISSALHIQKGLEVFPNAKRLILKDCSMKFSNFSLPTKFLWHLDLSQNQISRIVPKLLRSVLLLRTLIVSHNKISQIKVNVLNILTHLEILDLSYNRISVISNDKSTKRYLKNLRVLKLQYNYISVLSEEIFSFSFLSQLYHLDLRWNSIECYCELTQNFGRWLAQGSYSLSERPGLLPRCFALLRFGECVSCVATEQNKNANKQPLVQFATTSVCTSSFSSLLTAVFTSFFFLFTAITTFFCSSKGTLWLAKFATQRARSANVADEEQNFSAIFAFHGFVMFDTEDAAIGNWVDDRLVPKLSAILPNTKLEVSGRDDQCGFTPVTQQLLKIEASRKVIVVLTGNYWQSSPGKYMLSALEDLYYRTGHNRAVIVTFENEFYSGGLLRRRRNNSPWSVLKYPADERRSALFWEALRTSLML